MSRRVLSALALVASTVFASCAEPLTAPPQPRVAPSTAQHDAIESSCKSGWISSEGRC